MNKINAEGIVKHLLIGIVLITVMALPAAATSVLDIEVTEYLNVEDTFNGTLYEGLPSGSGVINITNNLTATDLYDISLNFTKGTTDLWTTTSPGVTLDTSNADYVIVNINSLEFQETKNITYQCMVTRPIAFEESYGSDRLLVNDSTTVSLTLNNTMASTITNIILTKTATDSNNDLTPDFEFSATDTIAGTALLSGDKDEIVWSGFSLNAGTTATLNFTATENDADAHANSESQSAVEYYMGNATLQFTTADSSTAVSGLTVAEEPTAITYNFAISLDKNQLDMAEGGNGGGDDWGFTPSINNMDTESIEFSISAVNVYVTNNTALDTVIDTTTYTDISLTAGEWTGSEWKVMDFPDPVPVGWIDVDLSVNFSEDLPEDQLLETYTTTYGNYMLIEKIYIINGYLVEARKTISKNATDDQYDISLWVHNKGSLKTPPHVVVYDIVPQNFTMVYNDTAYSGSTAVTVPFQGTAYWWDVGALEADGTPGNQTYVNYTVSGSGIYSMSDLFILGIDPAYSLNLPSTPVLTTGSKVAATTGMQSIMSVLMLVSLLVGVVGMRRNRKD
ncbi:hypothetical protein ACT9XH_09455 [Methanococcoides methylutens]|uniref:hypothetical protein n=1 Tax=Methanococcoides methylutens TaxID=2226 RepID=UPI0040444D0F